jgi:hypothetical protein
MQPLARVLLLLGAFVSVASAEVPRNQHAWAPAAEPVAKPKSKAATKPKTAPKSDRHDRAKRPSGHVPNDAVLVVEPPPIKDARLAATAGILIVPPHADPSIVLAVPAPSPPTHGPCRGS